ncbi:hypothetical protein GUITHDRAFT_116729 [Guillardia theta CCMP2712]|uniref:Uncharacterized protein n=1 Tax=Guillardia theta (strain CCMP2712) TaxID=905079 RepID=L1IMN6_GUITC|nr:hypothetical protein GUITHDRAFT_116729 [Guillardia theta CCMP2712]EKX37154.1 hypothetical protein GUITHDRAFT_116729 [Guillardia theta CCMP2712]|eukprot:XP_005824134.1 hypothetical protein GUITHDRAFT_116729 [Guillardia theta CCMP2712]
MISTMELQNQKHMLNDAWDRQVQLEQKFDIITHQPKRGHIHEVVANHTDYNIISTLKYADHHWAPPALRPPRIPSPPRKQPFLTNVNRPREFDIISNTYKEHHGERMRFEADKERQDVMKRFWKGREFDAIKVRYTDEEKEEAFQSTMKENLLRRGKDWIKKLPPTYQQSESTMFNITSHLVKDEDRLNALKAHEAAQSEMKAKLITEREEDNRAYQYKMSDLEMTRKLNRISHQRYKDVTDRGFHILSNDDFDICGLPPAPYTRPAMSLNDLVKHAQLADKPQTGQTLQNGGELGPSSLEDGD